MELKLKLLTICVGLALSIAAFANDALLPSLPLMAEDLGVDIVLVQQVVPVFMFGYGFGQLIFGPLSDRFGRLPALLGGLAVFTVGTIIALFTADLSLLLAARLIQGIGAGASQTVGRAMVRDKFSGHELASTMATASAIFAVGPIAAPILGYALAQSGSWRAVLAGMIVFALLLGLLAWAIGETSSQRNRGAIAPSKLLSNIKVILANAQSRYFVFVAGFAFTAIVLFLATMPRIFTQGLGLSPLIFAITFSAAASGIVIGQWGNRWMIMRFGPVKAMEIGAAIVLASAVAGGLAALFDLQTAFVLGAVMFLFNAGYLTVFSNGMSLVIDPHGPIAGFAASTAGLSASLIGSTIAGTLVPYVGMSVGRWALCEGVIAIILIAALLNWRRQQ